MCAQGRPDETDYGARIFAGEVSDAYLQKDGRQRGYTIVIWRGRHVAEPTELDPDEATAYWRELLQVGRALEEHFEPVKMNYETLGNSLPHLHTHVIPRYLDDGEPGQPSHFMRIAQPDEAKIPEAEYARDLAALRAILDN